MDALKLLDDFIKTIMNLCNHYSEQLGFLKGQQSAKKIQRQDEATNSILPNGTVDFYKYTKKTPPELAEEKTKTQCKVLASKDKKTREVFDMLKLKIKGLSVGEVPRKDGRFQGHYHFNGKRQYIYGASYEEACIKLLAIHKSTLPAEIANNSLISKEIKKYSSIAKYTVKAWIADWLEKYKVPNVKPKTLDGLKRSCEIFQKDFGEYFLSAVDSDRLQVFINGIKETAPRTAELVFGAIKQLFEKAKQKKLVSENPCDFVEFKKTKGEHHKTMSLEEQAVFVKCAKDSFHSFLFILMLETGVRIGEALALTAEDFDLKNNTLRINKNVVWIDKKRIDQDMPKSAAGIRMVPLTTNITNLYNVQPREGLIFTVSYDGAKSAFRRVCKEAGLKGFVLHSLRHTYATRLAEALVPDKVRQYLLGHSTQEMTTNTYTVAQTSFIDQYSNKICDIFDTQIDT